MHLGPRRERRSAAVSAVSASISKYHGDAAHAALHRHSAPTEYVREGREEIGVHIDEADLRFVHLAHYRNHLGDARLGVFFEVQKWTGEPYNAEPHKCSRIAWWPTGRLPDATYPYTAEGVRAYLRGQHFGNVGWTSAR